jgi:hypothetical protein
MIAAQIPLDRFTSTPAVRSAAKSGHSATAWRMGQIDLIAKSLEHVRNWRSRSEAFTVAASV